MHAALTPASIVTYRRSWKLFSDFINLVQLQGSFPVSITTLALYIAYLVEQGYRPATISTHISAMGYMHKLQGLQDCTGSFLILQLLKSIHKTNPTVDTQLHIDKHLLDKLIDSHQFVTQSRYEIALFRAMFAIAFHAFLRIGEITICSMKADKKHLLQLENV